MKRFFIHFLCVSFLMMTGQVHWIIAEAKEKAYPMGEMISRGTVKFEVKENVWKQVESSHFPLFKGARIKTESGHAVLILPDKGRIEINPRSLFSLDTEGRFVLTEGSIQFHLPMTSEINFRIGNLSITQARTLQAAKGLPASSTADTLTAGSISIHSNGSVTLKTTEGKLNVINQDKVFLAAIPKNESVTIPSVTVSGPSRVMVAQAGETATTTTGTTGAFLGISTWGWVGIIAAVAVVGVVVAAAGGGGGGSGGVPICP